MTEPKNSDQPELPEEPAIDPADESDVEGHSLWMNPSASREMTNGRSREIEREMRERQRAKEAKGNR